MGHTLDQWCNKVEQILRDETNRDLTVPQIQEACVRPAIVQFSIDRPRILVVQAAGNGTGYYSLPSGWVTDFSELRRVEYPANEDPPSYLDLKSWQMIRSVADADVEQILLDRSPAASETLRFHFTATWPFPTTTAADDKISDPAYEAVAQLAAAFGCETLANEASRDRMGAIAANVVDGRARATALLEAAKRKRDLYNAFVGIRSAPGGGSGSGGSSPAASGSFDLDPSRSSVFHGGRR